MVAKLANARDLKSLGVILAGSSPAHEIKKHNAYGEKNANEFVWDSGAYPS